MTPNKKIVIVGGGTSFKVDSHLSLVSPAYGLVAKQLTDRFGMATQKMDVALWLTKMAYPSSTLDTYDDLAALCDEIIADPLTKIVIWAPAVVDFSLHLSTPMETLPYRDGRIPSNAAWDATLEPLPKLIDKIRAKRKDIFLVGFKQTDGAVPDQQYAAGLAMLKRASCNLVVANDKTTRLNMIVTPEESTYAVTTSRGEMLGELVDMCLMRSHLTFTRSTVVAGELVPWKSDLVPSTLRDVVDYCRQYGAYKEFNGATVGHFAAKLSENVFLTSQRKTNFNDIDKIGLVRVETDGPDNVIAYGAKPSVGGQSQRLVFAEHPELDCIVHFHCEKRKDSLVPTVSQREFECGSHECGQNTSTGLQQFGDLWAVYLDNHGPNIVFSSKIDAGTVVDFINKNFDLNTKTGGFQLPAKA